MKDQDFVEQGRAIARAIRNRDFSLLSFERRHLRKMLDGVASHEERRRMRTLAEETACSKRQEPLPFD